MGDSVEVIAGKMREALEKDGFFALLHAAGDYVDTTMSMVHVPGNAIDGDMTKDEVRAMYDGAEAMYAKTCPDGVSVDGTVTVKGEVITTDLTMNAVLSNGSALCMNSISEWTVVDGHVVCVSRKLNRSRAAGTRP